MTAITARIVPIIVTALLTATTASANTMSWVNVPVPLGTNIVDGFTLPFGPPGAVLGNLDGFQSWDLTLDTTSDWTAALLLITLTDGSIWQEPDDTAAVIYNGQTLGLPNAAFFGVLPSSEFDSYVFDPHGGAQIQSACGAIGPCPHTQFDTSAIDIVWGGSDADAADVGIFSIARVTLSPNAQGSWLVRFTVAGLAQRVFNSGAVINGAPVPEPASLVLLSLGVLGLAGRRNTKRSGGRP